MEDEDVVPEKDQRQGDPINVIAGVAATSPVGRSLPPPETPISNIRVGAATAAEPSPLNSTSSTPSPESDTTDTTKAKSTPTTGGNSAPDGRTLDEMMAADNMADATTAQKTDGVSVCLHYLCDIRTFPSRSFHLMYVAPNAIACSLLLLFLAHVIIQIIICSSSSFSASSRIYPIRN